MDARVLLVAGLTATAFLFADVAPSPVDAFGVPSAYAKGGSGNGHGDGGRHDGDNGQGNGGGKAKSGNDGSGGGTPAAHGAFAGDKHSRAGSAVGTGSLAGSKARAAGAVMDLAAVGPKNAAAEADEADAKDKVPDGRLDALLAANADLQAFVHAGPASQAGRIALYAQALVALEGASAGVALAERTLTAAETRLTAATAIRDTAVEDLRAAYPNVDTATLQDTRNALANDLLNSDDQSEIDKINAKIAAIDKALCAEATLAAAESALGNAAATLADTRFDADKARRETDNALAAATNKMPINADAKAHLDDQLQQDGILDYYRSLTSSPSSTE